MLPPESPRTGARRLGALTIAALALTAFSGIPLALAYVRDPAQAHDAVARMLAGPLSAPRGAHAWGASLVLVLVVAHLARSHVTGRMRVAGRGVALLGVASLAALLAVFFTGTILDWDQQGWEALQHLDVGASMVGLDVADEPTAAPLSWIFAAHVFALPALLVAGVVAHLRRGRIAADARRLAGLLREQWVALVVAFVGVALAARLYPPAFGPTPIAGISTTKPDWPFLWLVPLQDWLGAPALLTLPLAFLAAGALLARRREPSTRARIVGLAIVASAWAGLTLWGALA